MCLEYRPGRREDIPALRALWKEAFGDSDAYLDTFFDIAFSPRRCRVAASGEFILAALYWFSCRCGSQSLAYIYAVGTGKEHRGKGIATELMKNTQTHLQSQGIGGVILVPATGDLVRFYAKLGYRPCAPQGRMKAESAGPAVQLKAVSPRRYGELREAMLPPGSVVQDGINLDFLATQVHLYAGKNLLLAARAEENGTLLALELLCPDPVKTAPGVLKALRLREGIFRLPYQNGRPFALFLPLKDWQGPAPGYFAFAFD